MSRIATAVLLFQLCLVADLGGQQYEVISLGNLPNHFVMTPEDISLNGTVVGVARLSGSNERNAFVYDQVNGIRELAGPSGGAGSTYAYGISPNGMHITGQIPSGGFTAAGQWDLSGGNYVLSNMGSVQRTTTPNAINNSQQFVGTSAFTQVLGFAHDGSSYVSTTLGRSARDINESGIIVGQVGTTAFVTDISTLSPQNLGTLGGSFSDALALNDLGAIVGYSSLASGENHAFLFAGSTMLDLGTLGGDFSVANDINFDSLIVGESRFDATTNTRAFIWDSGVMTDLNTMIDPSSDWVLERATAVNDDGWIVGVGTFDGTVGQGFLLKPVPEPSGGFVLMILAGLLVRRQGRHRRR